MVITRSVLNEIIKDEYEKLLTEAVEEAACGKEEGAVEEGQLDEQGVPEAMKQVIPIAVAAMIVGGAAVKGSMSYQDSINQMLTVTNSTEFDADSFEPFLTAEERDTMARFGISKGNPQSFKAFMAGPAIRIAKEGKVASMNDKNIPKVKEKNTATTTKVPTKGPTKSVVPAAAAATSPKGGVKIREGEFPRPRTAAPEKG